MSGSAPARRLILLGSTGSIGRNTLEVVSHLNAGGSMSFEVVGLATGTNAGELSAQAARFEVAHLALADGARAQGVEGPARVFGGADAAEQLIDAVAQPGDLVVCAMVGAAGIPATLAAIEHGCDIALANKETLVAAGALVMPRVRERDVKLVPIDSEHSAIFQCIAAGRETNEIKRLVLTASGGPFRTWTKQRVDNATVEEALDHPTWSMGPKVTIDSASLMNKALEIIEAHWLFGMDESRIDAVIHPQSIVHSFVEFIDGSVMAQLSPPDMKLPIQYALTWPHRVEGCAKPLPWSDRHRLEFEPVDHDRFPALSQAKRVLAAGGTSGAVFNAANEVAVEAFLTRGVSFGAIAEVVGEVLDAVKPKAVEALSDILQADAEAREAAGELLTARTVQPSVGVVARSSSTPPP